VFGLGASGGRRIMPAVGQVATFLAEFGHDLETALHHPRIDVSGSDVLIADRALDDATLAALRGAFDVHETNRTVFPSWFANISAVQSDGTDRLGGSEPSLPWADAVAESKT
jgi:gamma-glutamyltranspeptidase/glutathione hydrolase